MFDLGGARADLSLPEQNTPCYPAAAKILGINDETCSHQAGSRYEGQRP